jgi:hypothetical protein
VVLEVLREVTMAAGDGDRLDDLATLRPFELGELRLQALHLVRCQLDLAHRRTEASNPR